MQAEAVIWQVAQAIVALAVSGLIAWIRTLEKRLESQRLEFEKKLADEHDYASTNYHDRIVPEIQRIVASFETDLDKCIQRPEFEARIKSK